MCISRGPWVDQAGWARASLRIVVFASDTMSIKGYMYVQRGNYEGHRVEV